MATEQTVSIKKETKYISEKEHAQNDIETHKAIPKIEGLVKNLDETGENNQDQKPSLHIYDIKDKTFLKQSITDQSGLISVLDDDWEMFECNKCDKKFKARSTLYTHKKTVHSGIIPKNTELHCDQCAYASKRKDNLKEHIKNIHEKEVCDLCGKGFSYRSLIDHKKVVHEGILYNCNQCGLNLTTKGNLKAHKKKKHNTID